MAVLILAICALSFSLVYSQLNAEKDTDSGFHYVPDTVEAVGESDESAELSPNDSVEAVQTTTTRVSVSMTKQTTEPEDGSDPDTVVFVSTPPVVATTAPEGDSTTNVTFTNGYDKSFFADDLFIGDSISTGLYLYSKLDMKNVAAGVGYTPYKAYTTEIELYDGTSATALDYAASMQPKRIFVMLGSNGMASTSDIDAMKTTYSTLMEKLAASCPNSELYCISVTPVTANSSAAAESSITNEMIRTFNEFIEQYCEQNGLTYIDLYSQLIDDSGCFSTEYAEVDGMHFLGTTYDVMLGYIESELE
jgi:hypothetical protein